MQMLSFLNPFAPEPNEELRERRRSASSLLHDAALWNDTEKIKMLLRSGAAHVNEFAENTQETALMWAAQEGHVEAAQLLIDNGAKVGIKDENGRTALDIAMRQQNYLVVDLLTEEERRQKRRSRKAAAVKASKAEAQERAKAEAAMKMSAVELAVRVMLVTSAVLLLGTGLLTWVSPSAGLRVYGYDPTVEEPSVLRLEALNGMARLVLGAALLLPRYSSLWFAVGLLAWLPNYAELKMPPTIFIAMIVILAALQLLLMFRTRRWSWWPVFLLATALTVCVLFFILGVVGGIFPTFAAEHIYQLGVHLTPMGELQVACFSLLAPLGFSVWVAAHRVDRVRHGAMASGFAAVSLVMACHQWRVLKFYLDDPVRASPTSDAYDATGFVAALLCFGSLMALAVFSVFALVVRINKLLTKERKLRIQQLFTRKSRRAEAMV
ncbi:hypothetical protein AB1Y20_019379 [Prymnesium parvum]|uniref:Ankyrin repeat domain-containing protein n=1 Tax=Prymnesium parvum TaxID=97485 RepID=A0AB34JUT9_PRYPA